MSAPFPERSRTNKPYYHILVLILVFLFLLPFAWMIVSSLRSPGLPPPRGVEWLPQPLAWENYQTIFTLIPLGRYIVNSLFVSLAGAGITWLSASLAGFGMAMLSQRAQRILLIFSIGLLMVPLSAFWLPRFLLFTWLDWIDSYLALLAPAIMGTSPFFVLLFYWAYRRISAEHFDAACLEGLNPLGNWFRIGLPQVHSTSMVVVVLAFIVYWNDFINPLLYLKTQSRYTLAVGLQQLQQLDRTNWPLLLAGSVIMTLPVIVLFLLVQGRFLSDISVNSET